jgi:phage gp36-like protein
MDQRRYSEMMKRAESRRLRAIARAERAARRDARAARRAMSDPTANIHQIPTLSFPEPILPITPPPTRERRRGCGGCRKRAERFRQQVKDEATRQMPPMVAAKR